MPVGQLGFHRTETFPHFLEIGVLNRHSIPFQHAHRLAKLNDTAQQDLVAKVLDRLLAEEFRLHSEEGPIL
jgi:hypothetical protein